ncbi:MAG TPA: TatD family hydrolase [Thermoanaerobaculia bacterium]|nr:TatD family hydrolase [Thermoanaerobaculia bacterium]
MRLTDSHCHLAMHDQAADALDRARAAGVRGFVVPGTKLDDSRASIGIAAAHADVWCAVGFHPHEASSLDDAAWIELQDLAVAPRVVAIGEIGLDYHYNYSPADVQRSAFMRQVQLAKERNLPVIVHNRESSTDLLAILESEEARGGRGILHSFTDTFETARRLIDLGFFISFSGIVTFKSAAELREVARRLPHDRVLIETDTPYLAPVPHRGKENEPAYVGRVAEVLAGLWGLSIEDVARQTTENFESAFSVRLPA